MRVYAFVPARSGSKGLPDKNIMLLDGHPLMAYAIFFGQALGIDRVLVSTDSEHYQSIALRYGADCPYLRGAAASSDTAMEEEILADMADNLPRYAIELPDVWVRLKPTNPFRSVDAVRRGLRLLSEHDDIHSVRIVSEAEARVHVVNSDGFLEPAHPDWDRTRSVMRRNEFAKVYQPFNLDILRHREWMTRGPGYMGARVVPIIEHKITGLDINDADDFEIIKALVEARPPIAVVERYLIRAPDHKELTRAAGAANQREYGK